MEENYILNYDPETGSILGFYLKSIHGDNIPSPNIEITQEKYDFYMQNNGKYRIDPKTFQDIEIPVVLPSQTDPIKAQLLDLDTVLPRCVEDLIVARSVDVTTLPQIMQDRLTQKQDLRAQLQQLNAK